MYKRQDLTTPASAVQENNGLGTLVSDAFLWADRTLDAAYADRDVYKRQPMEIWATTSRALAAAVDAAHIDPKAIAGIGITNQRETAILWDRRTGQPVYLSLIHIS